MTGVRRVVLVLWLSEGDVLSTAAYEVIIDFLEAGTKPLSAIGTVTARILCFNDAEHIRERRELIASVTPATRPGCEANLRGCK